MKESERTHVLKEHFVEWFRDGLSIKEIAKQCNLSRATVYRHLQAIADAYGVEREEFLQIIRTPTPRQYGDEEARTKVNAEKLLCGFDKVSSSIAELREQIKNIMEED